MSYQVFMSELEKTKKILYDKQKDPNIGEEEKWKLAKAWAELHSLIMFYEKN